MPLLYPDSLAKVWLPQIEWPPSPFSAIFFLCHGRYQELSLGYAAGEWEAGGGRGKGYARFWLEPFVSQVTQGTTGWQ